MKKNPLKYLGRIQKFRKAGLQFLKGGLKKNTVLQQTFACSFFLLKHSKKCRKWGRGGGGVPDVPLPLARPEYVNERNLVLHLSF